MLGVVFVSLVIKARKEERLATRYVEPVKESVPTATRVLSPEELRIVDSKMEILDSENKSKVKITARHSLVVQDTGSVGYTGLHLEFYYWGRSGRLLGKKSYSSIAVIPSGKTVALDDISLPDVPQGTMRSTARILSAELLPSGATQEPAKGR